MHFVGFIAFELYQSFIHFRVGSYDDSDETDSPSAYGTFANGRPFLRTQTTVDETAQGAYQGFKGSLTGFKLYWTQFLGLIVKRLIYTKRRYLLYGILVSFLARVDMSTQDLKIDFSI